MNTLIKNLSLDYSSRDYGGAYQATGEYPTDLSFIKAWECADHIEDLHEKFDSDVNQMFKDEVQRHINIIETVISNLSNAGSLEKYFEGEENSSYKHYRKIGDVRVGYSEHLDNDAVLSAHVEAASRSFCQYSQPWNNRTEYYFYIDFSEAMEKLKGELSEYREDLKRNIACYTSVNRDNFMQKKRDNINSTYNIDLKELDMRPIVYCADTEARKVLYAFRARFQKYNEIVKAA